MWDPRRRRYLQVRDQVRLLVEVAFGQSLEEQPFGPVELGECVPRQRGKRGLQEIV